MLLLLLRHVIIIVLVEVIVSVFTVASFSLGLTVFIRVVIIENVVIEVGVEFTCEVTVEAKDLFGRREHYLAHGAEGILEEDCDEDREHVGEEDEGEVHENHVLVVIKY